MPMIKKITTRCRMTVPRRYFSNNNNNINNDNMNININDNHIDGNNINNNYKSLSLKQRMFLTAGAAAFTLLDTHRGDLVALISETTGESALKTIYERMSSNAEGREILKDRPRFNDKSVSLDTLLKLSKNTLGYQYALYMRQRGFCVHDRSSNVQFIENQDYAYVLQRYREVHDIWHVLLDCETTILGELQLKWFETLHIGLPSSFLSSLVGPVRLTCDEKQQLISECIPWAWKTNQLCDDLMSVYYEKYFTNDIESIRRKLGLVISL